MSTNTSYATESVCFSNYSYFTFFFVGPDNKRVLVIDVPDRQHPTVNQDHVPEKMNQNQPPSELKQEEMPEISQQFHVVPGIKKMFKHDQWITPHNPHAVEEYKQLISFDEPANNSRQFFDLEIYQAVICPELPPPVLVLKKNSKLILTTDLLNGASKGTKLKVVQFTRNIIQALILTGPRKGDSILIPRIKTKMAEKCSFHFVRLQFPVTFDVSEKTNP